MARIAFIAADWIASSIVEHVRKHSLEVKSVQAHVTTRHADYESSVLGIEVHEELQREELQSEHFQDHDTQDDSPSAVVLEIANKTVEELEELSRDGEDFYVL